MLRDIFCSQHSRHHVCNGITYIQWNLSSEAIQATHSEALSEVGGRLISLSIVPASLTMSLPAAVRSGRVSESSGPLSEGEREDSILSTSSEVDMDSSISEVCGSLSLSLHHSGLITPHLSHT